MSKIETALLLIKNPGMLMYTLSGKGYMKWIPDKLYLNVTFRLIFGKSINWSEPKSFNEKLQWLKINDRNPIYPSLVDKYEVKRIIEEQLGREYVIPTIGIWENVEDIDFYSLPDRFVLKCTHDSGSVIICKDKGKLDIETTKKFLHKHMKRNLYWFGREWPYKHVRPRVIAEKYLEESDGQLKDYKFMCFNGEMKCCFVFSDRYSETGIKLNVYNKNWEHMSIGRKYTTNKEGLLKPINYELMVEFAEKLSKKIPFVRVDFYEVKGKIYFGEMTFYPNAGFTPFEPEKWDTILGEWLVISQNA